MQGQKQQDDQQQPPGVTKHDSHLQPQQQEVVIKPLAILTPDKEHYDKTFSVRFIKILSCVQIALCIVNMISTLVCYILDQYFYDGTLEFVAGVLYGVWAFVGFQVKDYRLATKWMTTSK